MYMQSNSILFFNYGLHKNDHLFLFFKLENVIYSSYFFLNSGLSYYIKISKEFIYIFIKLN